MNYKEIRRSASYFDNDIVCGISDAEWVKKVAFAQNKYIREIAEDLKALCDEMKSFYYGFENELYDNMNDSEKIFKVALDMNKFIKKIFKTLENK